MNATMSVKHLDAVDIVFVAGDGFRDKSSKTGWAHDVWLIKITVGDHSLSTPYNTGIGHRRRSITTPDRFYFGPETVQIKIEEVLQSLFLDADAGTESFAEFCDNSGLQTDSRKALETYLKCQETGANLRRLFGADYDAVADEVKDK